MKNEDELLSLFCLMFRDKEIFPKVKRIARTPISPDIDLLEIEEEPFEEKSPKPIHERRKIIGYEVKLLKYDRGTKNFRFNAFYEGLGQAICYLQHGVHRTNVVLGTEYLLDREEGEYDRFTNYIRDTGLILKKICPYIGVYWFEWEWGELEMITARATADFSVSPNSPQAYKRESLQRKQFSYAKKFLRDALEQVPPWPEEEQEVL